MLGFSRHEPCRVDWTRWNCGVVVVLDRRLCGGSVRTRQCSCRRCGFLRAPGSIRDSAARTKHLELRVAEQQERAAKAERDLLEITERQNDRQFTDEQYLSIVNALARDGEKTDVQLMFVDQREPKRFAELLADVFQRAGG